MNSINLEYIPYNQRIFFEELLAHGVIITQVPETEIFQATLGDHSEFFYDLASAVSSYTSSWIIGDKFYSKQVLKMMGYPVPAGKVFNVTQLDEACVFAKQITFPVVIKPPTDGQGEFVYPLIENESELRDKISFYAQEYKKADIFLLEKHVLGNEYRIFVTKKNFVAAVQRVPATVIGDGTNSVMNLIDIENFKRLNPRVNCLCNIKLDDVLFDYLDKKNLSLEYVPKLGEAVQLRTSANVSKGGNCYEVTDKIHPDFKKLMLKLLNSFPQLGFVGIDIFCDDISKSPKKQTYSIGELNVAPGLSLHTLPESGKSQNTPLAVAQIIFPEIS